MFGKILSAFVAGLAVASAYTTPVGNPSGNPISKPGLNEQVPAGQPYTITWNPTTTGTVSILLLRGPSTNVVPIQTLVEGTPNTGTYVWTPDTSLQPDTSGYGLQLIVDGTGQYQYSTQFGISNPSYTGVISTIIGSVTPTYSSGASASATKNATASASATVTSKSSSNSTITSTTKSVASTGAPGNGSIVSPTGSLTVPSTLRSTATATSASASASKAVSTGAAGAIAVNLGGAALAFFAAVAAF